MNKITIASVVFLMFCSTQHDLQTKLNQLLTTLDIELEDTVMVVLIVPIYDGCASCSQTTLEFMSNYYESNLVTIISFREENTKKSLLYTSQFFNDGQDWTKKIYIDSNNICFKEDIVFNNPRIILLDRSRIKRTTELKPISIDDDLLIYSKFLISH